MFPPFFHPQLKRPLPIVLHRLYEASIKGAEIDSKARHPPPRCHPGTRTSVTRELYARINSGNNERNLIWVVGFAGVGKTAVAQTVGEWAKHNSLLGAAFFFSRTRNHTDPSRLFVSISYQLAVQNEEYRRLVSRPLSTDLGLLEKDMRTQFKRLLVEPLSKLKLDKKLLVIIDGLDECEDHDDQCEVIHLIGGAVDLPDSLPIVWMICSRPESHIKRTFFQPDFKIRYWKMEVALDDSETRGDIETFIRAGFKEIVEKFTAMPGDGTWPVAEDVEKVVSASSGLFAYASTIVKFVGDKNYANPEGQLKAVIAFIDDSPARSITENPFHYLDKLYEQILSDVPKNSLPLVLQLLAVITLYPTLPALQLANVFGLSKVRFYTLFLRLHSVLDIPQVDKVSQEPIRAFHASFLDFIKDPIRAGRLTWKQDVHADFVKACLGILAQTNLLRYAKSLVWPPEKNDLPTLLLARHIVVYCGTNAWRACTNVVDTNNQDVIDMIVDFDYRHLRSVGSNLPPSQFYDFSLWLQRQVCTTSLI